MFVVAEQFESLLLTGYDRYGTKSLSNKRALSPPGSRWVCPLKSAAKVTLYNAEPHYAVHNGQAIMWLIYCPS